MAALLCVWLFWNNAVNAQKNGSPDTAIVITDSVVNTGDDTTEEPEVDTETNAVKSVYFTDRRFQPNGGGPGVLQSRTVPDSTVKKIKSDADFWYVNYLFDKVKKEQEKDTEDDEPNTPLTETTFFQVLLWLVIIGGF